MKFSIGRSFLLASGSHQGFILVGPLDATLNTSVRGEWPRLISPRAVATQRFGTRTKPVHGLIACKTRERQDKKNE
jgi:hypothetical protein